MLVARTLTSAVDETRVRGQLAALRDRFVATVPDGATPTTLARYFAGEGFTAAEPAQIVDASCIDWVLEHRRGIPISLSVPYILVGRGLGLHTEGVNFPGHFLVRAEGALVDPLSARVVEGDEATRWLAEAGLSHLATSAFAAATADTIAVRMFNNVKSAFVARGDFVAALALIDCQLEIVDDPGPLHLERAELWFRLGNSAAAMAVLEDAKSHLSGTRWEGEIDGWLKRLAAQPRSTIH